MGLGQVTDALEGCGKVLLVGAGGGNDIISGVPLWHHLRAAGADVHMANVTFTPLDNSLVTPADPAGICFPVTPGAGDDIVGEVLGGISFPELHLARFLAGRGDEHPTVWALGRGGTWQHRVALAWLVDHLGGVDAVVAVDGGNDSLMGGWEYSLGSVVEDATTILAVSALDVPVKLLVCAGLGTDSRHLVTMADTLEAIAQLTAAGGWRGVCALTSADPGVAAMGELVDHINTVSQGRSTVANAVLAAAEGQFGHTTTGHAGSGDSQVWINPMMAMYWAFDLDAVHDRIAYRHEIVDTRSWAETNRAIVAYRSGVRRGDDRRIPI